MELGHFEGVTHMMRDFLAQCDLAERMAGRKVNDDLRQDSTQSGH
jgi:hypothetical protein